MITCCWTACRPQFCRCRVLICCELFRALPRCVMSLLRSWQVALNWLASLEKRDTMQPTAATSALTPPRCPQGHPSCLERLLHRTVGWPTGMHAFGSKLCIWVPLQCCHCKSTTPPRAQSCPCFNTRQGGRSDEELRFPHALPPEETSLVVALCRCHKLPVFHLLIRPICFLLVRICVVSTC